MQSFEAKACQFYGCKAVGWETTQYLATDDFLGNCCSEEERQKIGDYSIAYFYPDGDAADCNLFLDKHFFFVILIGADGVGRPGIVNDANSSIFLFN